MYSVLHVYIHTKLGERRKMRGFSRSMRDKKLHKNVKKDRRGKRRRKSRWKEKLVHGTLGMGMGMGMGGHGESKKQKQSKGSGDKEEWRPLGRGWVAQPKTNPSPTNSTGSRAFAVRPLAWLMPELRLYIAGNRPLPLGFILLHRSRPTTLLADWKRHPLSTLLIGGRVANCSLSEQPID